MAVADAVLTSITRYTDSQCLDMASNLFAEKFQRTPTVKVRAPGRVALLGAHIDYSEGYIVSAAVDRCVCLAAAPVDGTVCKVFAVDFNQMEEIDLDKLPSPGGKNASKLNPGWVNYVAGVAWALRAEGVLLTAMDIVVGSFGTLPMGAGVSSSAAFEMALLYAWRHFAPGVKLEGLQCAMLGRRVENEFCGVMSGIMDQFVSVHSIENQDAGAPAAPVRPLCVWPLLDSGVRRRLQGSSYNNRREECAQAVALLRPHLPHVNTLRDITPRQLALHAHRLPLPLRRRAQHAVAECERVLLSRQALMDGDLARFGDLMRLSHESSRDLYEVSIPELDVLAAAAWATEGCFGARLMGGGFGGCVVMLAESEEAARRVQKSVTIEFEREFGRQPDIFPCTFARGAQVVSSS
eukprot:jgi/Mesvir1/3779/Mv08186-RA.1